MIRSFATAGALFALSAVAFGAFGTHAIASRVTAERLETWATGAHYLGWQGAALLALAAIAASQSALGPRAKRQLKIAGWLVIGGTAIFSGSLFALVLSGIGALGAITPIGGTLMILGWGLALGALSCLKSDV